MPNTFPRTTLLSDFCCPVWIIHNIGLPFYLSTETSCENGIIYNSTCYKIHGENVTWFTAVNRCLSNNGSLAVFDDNITTYFATTLLTGRLWIGLIKSWWTCPDAGLYSWQWHQQVYVVFVWLNITTNLTWLSLKARICRNGKALVSCSIHEVPHFNTYILWSYRFV